MIRIIFDPHQTCVLSQLSILYKSFINARFSCNDSHDSRGEEGRPRSIRGLAFDPRQKERKEKKEESQRKSVRENKYAISVQGHVKDEMETHRRERIPAASPGISQAATV